MTRILGAVRRCSAWRVGRLSRLGLRPPAVPVIMTCYLTAIFLAAATTSTSTVLRSYIICQPSGTAVPGAAAPPLAGQGRRPESAGTAPRRGHSAAKPLRPRPRDRSQDGPQDSGLTYRQQRTSRRRALKAEPVTAKRRSRKPGNRGAPAREMLSHLQGGGSSSASSQYFHAQVDGAARVRVNMTKMIGLDPRNADLARAPR